MLSFINTNNLWLIAIALIVAFISSVIAFRLATSSWYDKCYHARLWLAGGMLITALGAWFIHAICIATINYNPMLTALTTALGATSLILATLLVSMLDLFLRNKKSSAHLSREKLSQMAMVDTLTQLSNRRALMQHMEAAASRSERNGTRLALAFVDIDNFKRINDSLGHHIGDEILQEVAKKLVAAVRSCDEVARIGGDEFIALIEEVKSDEDVITVVERMVTSVREITVSNHFDINISASIGIAMFPNDGSIEQLINAADTAMYRAKKDGKNQFRFFDTEIAMASDQLLETQYDLKNALANDEFKLHYQIKVDSHTREVMGAESLLRWQHPIRGLLYPADFMLAAERCGISFEVSTWVIEECCRTLHRLNELNIPFNLSINLSYQQLRNTSLVSEILEILKRFDLPTSSLLFELTESVALKNQSLFNNQLEHFRAANIKVSINDFGAQSSSLTNLHNFKVNELKLGHAITAKIDSNQKTRGIIGAIINLAHVLELNVVAEGVETEGQSKALAELGCDQMQGFFFSPPLPKVRFIGLLKNLNSHFVGNEHFSV